jgi:sugar lactone lactonase YvrE
VAVDAAGDLYIADMGTNTVTELPARGGPPVSVGSGLHQPSGVAVDAAGDVYIADSGNDRVVEDPAGGGPQVTIAGGLGGPAGVAVDAAGDVYIADSNNDRVLEVPAGGGSPITLLGGSPLHEDSGVAVPPPIAQQVTFTSTPPATPTVGGTYDITATGGASGAAVAFAADASSTPGACSVSGSTVTFTASGTCVVDADQAGNASYSAAPQAVQAIAIGPAPVTPASQTITFTSTPPSQPIARGNSEIWARGGVSGNPVTFAIDPSSTPGACSVSASSPNGYGLFSATVSFTARGTCVVDANQAGSANIGAAPQVSQSFGFIQLVPPVKVLFTLPSDGQVVAIAAGGGSTTGVGTGLQSPEGVAVDAAGDVFIADPEAGHIDEVTPAGVQTTIPDPGVIGPSSLFVDDHDDLFVTSSTNNEVVEIPRGGSDSDTVVPATGLSDPSAVAVDTAGDVYIVDAGNARVVSVTPAGVQTTVGTGLSDPSAVTVDAAGDVYIADAMNDNVIEVTPSGSQSTVLSGLNDPNGLAFDGAGNLYFDQGGTDESSNGSVTEVPADGSAAITLAGGLDDPRGVAVQSGQDITFTSAPPSPSSVGGTYTVRTTGGGSGNSVTLSIDPSSTASTCSVTGSVVTFTGVGTCIIDANQAGGVGYRAAAPATQTINVVPASVAVSASGSQTFGSSQPTFAFQATPPSGVSVSGTLSCTGITGGTPIDATLPAGAYTIDGSTCSGLSLSDSTDYVIAYAGESGGFTVNPAPQTITFTSTAPAAAAFGGTYGVTATGGASGNPVVFSSATPAVCSLAGATVHFVGIGTCTIDANQAGNADFEAAPQASQSIPVADTTPGAPTSLVAVPAANGIALSWTAPTFTGGGPLGGYDVLRGTAAGQEGPTPVATVTATSFDDTTAAPGIRYFYVVEAFNAVAVSTASAEASALVSPNGAGGDRLAATPDGQGYWVLNVNGTVSAFGNAVNYGSPVTRGLRLNQPEVGITATPDGKGYWIVAADGGVFTFGDATFHGSTGGIHLNQPVVGLATTPDGGGYWLVAADGGVFTFGDAAFDGSAGGIHLDQPVIGMTRTPDGGGYWLVASDGGVFTFGDAHFDGSLGGTALTNPVVGLIPAPTGTGYTIVSAAGTATHFGTP